MALSYSYEDTLPNRTNISVIWNILSLKRRRVYDEYENLVEEVEWSVTVSETINFKTISYTESGIVLLDIESLINPIDYYSLTKDQVLEWVKNELNKIYYIENHPDNYITRYENMMISNLRYGSLKECNNFPWD
jgi:hypothetical protein